MRTKSRTCQCSTPRAAASPDPRLIASPHSITLSNASLAHTNESLTRVNPSFARANDSIASANDLPWFQSNTPIARINDSFTRGNESKTLASQMTNSRAVSSGHEGTTPRNSHKTSHRRFSRASAFDQPPHPAIDPRRYRCGCGVDDPEGGGVVPPAPGGGVCGFVGGGVLAPFGGVGAPGVVPGGGVTAGFAVVAPGALPAPAGGVPAGGILEAGGIPAGGNPGRPIGGLAPGGGVGLVSLWLISSTSNTSSDFAGIGPLPVSPYASWYGMNRRRLPPIFIPSNPVSHPGIT